MIAGYVLEEMRKRAAIVVDRAERTYDEENLASYTLTLLDEVERLQEALERERRGHDDDRRTWETSGEAR